VRNAHDETLHLRLPAALRRDLDAAARAGGVRLSAATRNALVIGLATLRSGEPDRDPPSPAAPALRSAA
jgi:hypothetical protein